MLFFFFSSRRRHTRYWRDWSSDVCASDLTARTAAGAEPRGRVAAAKPAMGVGEAGGLITGGGARPAVTKDSRATSTTSGGSKKFPSKLGSIARIRCASGGCVAHHPVKPERKAWAKKK